MADETSNNEQGIGRFRPLKHARFNEPLRRPNDPKVYQALAVPGKPVGGHYHACIVPLDPKDGVKPIWLDWNTHVEMLEG